MDSGKLIVTKEMNSSIFYFQVVIFFPYPKLKNVHEQLIISLFLIKTTQLQVSLQRKKNEKEKQLAGLSSFVLVGLILYPKEISLKVTS